MHSFEISAFKPRHYTLIGVIIAAVIALAMLGDVGRARTFLISGDNDDIMRWMSIKDWLAGQGWFDMNQHRVEAPEGLSMHWSRYLDAMIGGLYSLLLLVMSPEAAERWTLVLWPNILLVALLVLVAKGTARILGNAAAVFAVLLVMTWFPLRYITFQNARIDHHNLQILLMTCVTMAMIWPRYSMRTGLMAGTAAAFSLAIGLEMIPFVAVAGVMLFLRAVFNAEGAVARLAGFCIALLAGSVVFFGGQTAPSEWLTPHCDALSTPFLAILLIAAVSCGLPLAFYGRMRHPVARIGVTGALTLAGLAVFSGLISPCLAGPYGMLPPEVQAFIVTGISEALNGFAFAKLRPTTFINVILPILSTTVFATFYWLRRRQDWTAVQRTAIGQMLLFCWLGLAGAMLQIRLNIIAAPALPFLAGFVLTLVVRDWQHSRRKRDATVAISAALTIILVTTISLNLLGLAIKFAPPAVASTMKGVPNDNACRSDEALAPLNTLPTARMLTTMDIGSSLLLTTHHIALSVPYQRGKYTFWNGAFAYKSQDLLLQAIAQSKPDYILICKTAKYGGRSAYARTLQEGDLPAWLKPVSIGSDDLLVLQVETALLP